MKFSIGVGIVLSGGFKDLDLAVELAGERILGDLQVVVRLQVHPELRLHAEKLAEPQCGICRDAAPARKVRARKPIIEGMPATALSPAACAT